VRAACCVQLPGRTMLWCFMPYASLKHRAALKWPMQHLAPGENCTLLQAVAVLAQGLHSSKEAVLWCKERAARAGGRVAALGPALEELERAVLAPGRGVEVRLVESLSIMLVLLAKVRPSLPRASCTHVPVAAAYRHLFHRRVNMGCPAHIHAALFISYQCAAMKTVPVPYGAVPDSPTRHSQHSPQSS
jgi:hypothetical protein